MKTWLWNRKTPCQKHFLRFYAENKYDLKQFATMNEEAEDVHADSHSKIVYQNIIYQV